MICSNLRNIYCILVDPWPHWPNDQPSWINVQQTNQILQLGKLNWNRVHSSRCYDNWQNCSPLKVMLASGRGDASCTVWGHWLKTELLLGKSLTELTCKEMALSSKIRSLIYVYCPCFKIAGCWHKQCTIKIFAPF